MNEQLKALTFYRILLSALQVPGVEAIWVTLDKDGELCAQVSTISRESDE